jgi:hypothetical protein
MSLGTPVIPQAVSVSQAVLVASAAYTVSDTTGIWPVDFFSAGEVSVVCTVGSGTLDVFVQKQLQDGVLFDDIAHFAQITTTGAQTLSFVNGGNTINAQKDAALAANTVITVAFGSYWRIKTVITGASPTFSFGVFGGFEQ